MGEYQTPLELKELQNAELDLAKSFLAVCERHNLKVFACYGTLLGCVRHKGFIPWDDDMDFVMLREDYDKLALIDPSEFPSPYKLVDAFPIYRYMNMNTSCIFNGHSKLDPSIPQGAFIDVFCIDAVPDNWNEFVQKFMYIKKMRRRIANKRFMSFSGGSIKTKLYHFYCCGFFVFKDIYSLNKELHDLQRKDSIKDNRYVIEYGVNSRLVDNPKKLKLYDKHFFDDVVMLPFEDITLPCPIGYDGILTLKYGDYMKPVMAHTNHGEMYVDLQKPFQEVIEDRIKAIPWYKRFLYRH